MRIRLKAPEIERSYDTQLGRFTDDESIPCFCCGECCRRWQPLVSSDEAERLAAFLGLAMREFLEKYTRPYPLDDEQFMLLERGGGCVFLQQDARERWLCSVHPARPQPCRDWDASLLRSECLQGMRVSRTSEELLIPLPLYDDPRDAALLVERLRSNAGRLPASMCGASAPSEQC